MASKHAWFWSTLLATLALDQGSKRWVVAALPSRHDEIVVVPHLLSIVHRENPAAAFGLLGDFAWRYVVFAVFTVIVCGVLVDLYRRMEPGDRLPAASVGLLLAGTLGNAIDRVAKRTVTDMIKVYTDAPASEAWLIERFGTAEWPTFNVADSALFVGLAVFLAHAVSAERDDPLSSPDGDGR